MSTQSAPSSTVLPREDQLIEFVVDGHDVTIVGTYPAPTPVLHQTDLPNDRLGGYGG